MSWLLLSLVGALVGLDATSFPQAMFSRPLIAATLAGLVFGRPEAGLAVGAVLEVFSLIILPFGAARYPESGTAAAAGAAAYAQMSTVAVEPRLLLLTVVFAFAWEQISGASVIFARRVNERLVAALPADPLAAVRVPRRHIYALAIDGVRGVWAVLLGALLGEILLRAFEPFFTLNAEWSARALMIAAAVVLGSALPLFGGLRQRFVAFGAGLVCGSLLLLVL